MFDHEMSFHRVPNDVNRLRIYYISGRELMDLLRRGDQIPQAAYFPILSGIPADADVWSIWIQSPMIGIGLLISHPTFDEVKEGHKPPDGGQLGMDYKCYHIVDDKFAFYTGYYTQVLQDLHNAIGKELIDREQANTVGKPDDNYSTDKGVFTQWACVFPGKMGISWKLASGPWDDKGYAEQIAKENCNVAVVPWEFWERYKEYEKRLVEAERLLGEMRTKIDNLLKGVRWIND